MAEYRLATPSGWEDAREAEPVVIEGFEEFEFFSSRAANKSDIYGMTLYIVNERTSGYVVNSYYGYSRQQAIAEAEEILNHCGKNDLRQAIAKAVAENFKKAGESEPKIPEEYLREGCQIPRTPSGLPSFTREPECPTPAGIRREPRFFGTTLRHWAVGFLWAVGLIAFFYVLPGLGCAR